MAGAAHKKDSLGPGDWEELAGHPIGVVRSNAAVELLEDVPGLDYPGLRVLFTSGYTERGPSREDLESPNLAFLQKPFKPDVLLRTVREMLERA